MIEKTRDIDKICGVKHQIARSARTCGASNVTSPDGKPYAFDPADIEPTNALDRHKLVCHMTRFWMGALGIDFLTIMAIFDASYGWQKSCARLTIPAIGRGNGRTFHGLGKEDRTVQRSIKRLSNLGVITVGKATADGCLYTLNTGWMPKTSPAAPKHLSATAQQVENLPEWHEGGDNTVTTEVASVSPIPVSKMSPLLTLKDNMDINKERIADRGFAPDQRSQFPSVSSLPVLRKRQRPAASPVPSSETFPASSPSPVPATPLPKLPEQLASSGVSPPFVHNPQRDKSMQQAFRQLAKPSALEKTFREAFAEAFQGQAVDAVPTWEKREFGMVKSSIISKWTGTVEEMHEFVAWIVREWPYLSHKHFRWMKDPSCPKLPDLRLICRFRSDLLSSWNDRAQNNWIASIPDNARRRYYELTFKAGMLHDAAILKLAEEKAKIVLRQEADEKLAKANLAVRTALIAASEAWRRPAFNPANPHPDSFAAKAARDEARRAEMKRLRNLKPVANYDEDFVPEPWRDDL